MMAFSGGDGLPYLRGNQALFSIPGQLIGFANGGTGEVEFMLLCVVIIAGVIYVQYCVVCIGICMHCVMKKEQLERVVRRASKIIGCSLPTIGSHYDTRISRKARKIISDPSHPAHHLFTLLPSGRRYRSITSKTSRFRDSTYLQAIRHLNKH